MTIDEKRMAIEEFCGDRVCSECPLKDTGHDSCYSDSTFVEEHYKILFGNGEYKVQNTPSVTVETTDNVNHPSHYETGKFECIDVMIETQGVEAVKHFCLCNAFKYLYRHNGKNGVEDIKKARWYIDKYLELEGDQK